VDDGSSDFMLEAGPGAGGISYMKNVPTVTQDIKLNMPGEPPQYFSLPAFSADAAASIPGKGAIDECSGNPKKLYYAVSAGKNPTHVGYYGNERGFGQMGGHLLGVGLSVPGDCHSAPKYYINTLAVTNQALVDFIKKNKLDTWPQEVGLVYSEIAVAGTGNIFYMGSYPSVYDGYPGNPPVYVSADVPLAASNGGNGFFGERGGRASSGGHGTDPNADGTSPSAGGGGAENGLGGYGGNGQILICGSLSTNQPKPDLTPLGAKGAEPGPNAPVADMINPDGTYVVGRKISFKVQPKNIGAPTALPFNIKLQKKLHDDPASSPRHPDSEYTDTGGTATVSSNLEKGASADIFIDYVSISPEQLLLSFDSEIFPWTVVSDKSKVFGKSTQYRKS
jgi:hypothetical protein